MKEVYVVYGKYGEVLYVGQGNLGRHRHCLNGTSHNQKLNKYFFSNGEDGSIRVEVLLRVKTSEEALLKESDLILELRPKFNHTKTTGRVVKPSQKPSCMYESLRCGFQVDFRVVMKEFCCQINSNPDQAHFILKYHPEIEQYYEALGEEKIKALKYRKKDVEIEYDILTRKTDMFYVVLDQLPYKEGDGVFGKDVVEVIKSIYQKCGIIEKVTSRTIHQYYDVKERFFYSEGKTKRGYKIIAKKGIYDLAKQQVFKV